MSALRNDESLADQEDREIMDCLRGPATDLLVEEALATVPQFVVHWFDWKGEDLKAIAREYIEGADELVRERVIELNRQEADQ